MTATRTHIAHGAFRLWHTFSSENLYTAQQGTTRNLMGYNSTNSELYKYQWDYIHNPQQGIVRWMVEDDESESANPFGFDFYDYFFSQIGNELSAMADAVTGTISSWFKYQKKEEKPVIPELSDNQKTIIEILTGIHDAEKNYTIKQRGSICGEKVKINGTEYKIALHILPDLKFSTLLTANNDLTLTKLAYTKDEHDDYALLHFKQSDDNDKIALTIQVEKSKAKDLEKWLFNEDDVVEKYEIKIVTILIDENEKNTFSSFGIDNGAVMGYFIEREAGTYDEERTKDKKKRIPAGTYNVIHNDCKKYEKSNKPRTNCANEFELVDTKKILGNRCGILIHTGTDYNDSEGCLLPVGERYTFKTVGTESKTDTKTYNIYSSNSTSTATLNTINEYVRDKEKQYGADNVSITIIINRQK